MDRKPLSISKSPHPLRWGRLALGDIRASLRNDPADIWLVSFPKTGGTWLKFMLLEIFKETYHLDGVDHTVNFDDARVNDSDVPKIVWSHDDSSILNEAGERPDPYRLFDYGGRRRYARNRVAHLTRDPRDVVVSHYHQVTKRSAKPMEFDDLSVFIRDPLYGFSRIIRYYQIWANQKRVPSAYLLLRYEDLHTNGVDVLMELLRFMGVRNADRSLVEKVYDASSADKLRKLEQAGKVEGMNAFGSNPDALKVRKAQIGGYATEMSEDDIAFCNDQMRALPAEYGYSPE